MPEKNSTIGLEPCSQTDVTASLHDRALRCQQGAVILVVMVVMLLGALLVAWSSRAALFSERVTGNEADYLMAFEAAQAMLADAELDALGIRLDGSPCQQGCRSHDPSLLQVPHSFGLLDSDGGDWLVLERAVQGLAVPCMHALCFDNGRLPVRFWLDTNTLAKMQQGAALHGEFTGTLQETRVGNSLLWVTAEMRHNRTLAHAWYWIEPLEFYASTTMGQRYAPFGQGLGGSIHGMVYRITAMARGRKPGTQAIVQSIVVPQARAVVAGQPPER